MKIINKVTLRHMMHNKRRTLVTMIGVIISVAMITAVSTFAASMFDFMQRAEMEDNGNWHVSYLNTKVSSLSTIAKDEGTKEMYTVKEEGVAALPQANEKEKPYLNLQSYDTNAFTHNFIELTQGRLPQTDSEIVVSQSLIDDSGNPWKIGDKISLDVGQREILNETESGDTEYIPAEQYTPYSEGERLVDTVSHTYTIVGIVDSTRKENSWSPGYLAYTYLDTSKRSADDTVDAYITVSRLNRSLYTRAEELSKKLTAAGDTGHVTGFHNALLVYYGCSNSDSFMISMYSIAAILILIIMIGSISLIYNAFAISVSERSKQFGMLSSIGATKNQKRDSVFFEGGIIGVVSIPLGILAGLAGAAGVFYFINQLVEVFWAEGFDLTFRVVFSIPAIVTAIIFSILTIFISAYIPARKASKITPIEAIRQSTEIKLTSKQVKTSKITRKLFGFEAELALKNLKRNRKRYRATVFSLVISIVLFLSVSYFTDAMSNAYTMTQTDLNFDRSLSCSDYTAEEITPILEKVSKVEGTDEWSVSRSEFISVWIPENLLSQTTNTILENDEKDGVAFTKENEQISFGANIVAVNEESLQKICQTAGMDDTLFNDPEHPMVLFLNSLKIKSNDSYYEGNILQSGTHSITLKGFGEESIEKDVTAVTLDDIVPLGFMPVSSFRSTSSQLIVSEKVFQSLSEELNLEEYDAPYLRFFSTLTPEYQKSEDLMAEYDTAVQKILDEDPSHLNIYYTNLTEARKQANTMIIVINIFVYGFIVLITAICVANVFNTISTSISVRKREFAMLRSVGMTPKSFNRMIRYESIFYGLKALLYGLPISLAAMWAMHFALSKMFQSQFILPWIPILAAVLCVFLIVGISMLYSSSKIKKANIIDALKDETI